MRSHARTGIGAIFFLLAQISGALLWCTYVAVWTQWQGGLGFLIGLISVPGIVIFPVLFFLAEHQLPTGYLSLWGITLLLWLLSAVSFGSE